MSPLRSYYWERKAALSSRTCDLFEPFVSELEARHALILEIAGLYFAPIENALHKEKWGAGIMVGTLGGAGLGILAHALSSQSAKKEKDKTESQYGQVWKEAIKSAQDWDIWRYVAAFDAESARLRKNLPA